MTAAWRPASAVSTVVAAVLLLTCTWNREYHCSVDADAGTAVGANDGTAWLPLPANSSCAKAFGIEQWSKRTMKTIESVFHFQQLPQDEVTLRHLNIGFGTTGTRFLANKLREGGYIGCHFQECNGGVLNQLMAHHVHLIVCYARQLKTERCRSGHWMNEFKKIVFASATNGVQFLTDTPVYFVFRELLDLVPNLEIVQSVRDPKDWVLDRIEKHQFSAELMCDPRKPANRGISTPFHILQCIPHSKYVHENLVVTGHYIGIGPHEATARRSGKLAFPPEVEARFLEVAQYYVDYTQRSMNTVLAKSLIGNYTPVCVFDQKIL